MKNSIETKLFAFERLLTIMDELREKCPWDKKQTINSLRHLTLEETYELTDAIIKGDLNEVKKELGDIVLHIVFYARIASETNDFDIADVLNSVCEKLIYRHPHVYGDAQADTEEQVKENWEKLKLKEGNKSVLGGVPTGMPAVIKAMRIQEKVRGVGFDWEHPHQVWQKVEEEIEELKVEVQNKNQEKIEKEFGDVLFSLINYARFVGINPEDALEKTNLKFINRFTFLEEETYKSGKKLDELQFKEMDALWEKSKKYFP